MRTASVIQGVHALRTTRWQQKQQHAVGSAERVSDKEGVDLVAQKGRHTGKGTPAESGRHARRAVQLRFEQTSITFTISTHTIA